ncbi:hypothetical protein D9M68_258850 [compost metagenome]
MEHQMGLAQLVVADQGPGVQAEARVGQVQIIAGVAGQAFQASAEVIGQVAEQSADEWQFAIFRRLRRAEACQSGSQALEERVGRFVGTGR